MLNVSDWMLWAKSEWKNAFLESPPLGVPCQYVLIKEGSFAPHSPIGWVCLLTNIGEEKTSLIVIYDESKNQVYTLKQLSWWRVPRPYLKDTEITESMLIKDELTGPTESIQVGHADPVGALGAEGPPGLTDLEYKLAEKLRELLGFSTKWEEISYSQRNTYALVIRELLNLRKELCKETMINGVETEKSSTWKASFGTWVEDPPIKEGDTVKLKSGGPLMVVSSIEDDMCNCHFYCEGDTDFFLRTFKKHCLIKSI